MNLRMTYTPQFRHFVRETPDLIRRFAKFYKDGAERLEEPGLRIERYHPQDYVEPGGSSQRNGQVNYRLWKAEAGGREWFVKETLRTTDTEYLHDTGLLQYRMTHRLSKFARALAKVWKHDIIVIEPQLAATYCDTSFIVSEFCPHRRAVDEELPWKLEVQIKHFSDLAYVFTGALDVHKGNSFYDQAAGKVLVTDPQKSHALFPVRVAVVAGKAAWEAFRKAFGKNPAQGKTEGHENAALSKQDAEPRKVVEMDAINYL